MYLASLGPKDLEGLEGGLVLLELKENQVLLVYLAEMDSLVLKVHRVLQALEVQWAHLGSRVLGDCQVQWGLRGHRVHLDCQGSQYVVQWLLSDPCLCKMKPLRLHSGHEVSISSWTGKTSHRDYNHTKKRPIHTNVTADLTLYSRGQ